MKMLPHSPGPWTYKVSEQYVSFYDRKGDLIFEYSLPIFNRNEPTDRRLIRAAPGLFALVRLYYAAYGHEMDRELAGMFKDFINDIEGVGEEGED